MISAAIKLSQLGGIQRRHGQFGWFRRELTSPDGHSSFCSDEGCAFCDVRLALSKGHPDAIRVGVCEATLFCDFMEHLRMKLGGPMSVNQRRVPHTRDRHSHSGTILPSTIA